MSLYISNATPLILLLCVAIALEGFLLAMVLALRKKVNELMATEAELIADLGAVKAQLEKIATESANSIKRIADLEAALAGQANHSQALVDAVAAVKAQAQVVDDLVPDAPPAPPV